jgi:broad specificity phosphatase PhoE
MIHIPAEFKGARFALFIRHAEREHIAEAARALEALLTEKGKDDAVTLGRSIAPFGGVRLYHSPVERCRQTAEKIAEGVTGAGSGGNVEGHLMELGGPYLTGNWTDIVAEIGKHGFDGFVRAWFDGLLPASLITPLDVAAKAQLRVLRGQLEGDGPSTVNVSHDWNVMCLREFYFGIRHEEAGTPAYLDGIAAMLQGDSLRLLCGDEERIVP